MCGTFHEDGRWPGSPCMGNNSVWSCDCGYCIRYKLHFRFSHKPGGNDLLLGYREDVCRYRGLLYNVSIIGAVMAACFLKILFPDAVSAVFLGTCTLGEGVGPWKAATIECLVTFLFVFTIFATAVDKRTSKLLAGVAIGLVYLFGVSISTTFSGGALNPARVFGPAVVSGHFDYHFVWWLGPVTGGIAADSSMARSLHGRVTKRSYHRQSDSSFSLNSSGTFSRGIQSFIIISNIL